MSNSQDIIDKKTDDHNSILSNNSNKEEVAEVKKSVDFTYEEENILDLKMDALSDNADEED